MSKIVYGCYRENQYAISCRTAEFEHSVCLLNLKTGFLAFGPQLLVGWPLVGQ